LIPTEFVVAQTANEYIELLRAKSRANQRKVIDEAMRFTPEQEKKFWPIYDQFEAQMVKIGDRRLLLIDEYQQNYFKMDNAKAKELLEESMTLEGESKAARDHCVRRLEQELSPILAARFFQIERQLQLVKDLQIAARLPLISGGEESGDKR
jgi:hypothetical protein